VEEGRLFLLFFHAFPWGEEQKTGESFCAVGEKKKFLSSARSNPLSCRNGVSTSAREREKEREARRGMAGKGSYLSGSRILGAANRGGKQPASGRKGCCLLKEKPLPEGDVVYVRRLARKGRTD